MGSAILHNAGLRAEVSFFGMMPDCPGSSRFCVGVDCEPSTSDNGQRRWSSPLTAPFGEDDSYRGSLEKGGVASFVRSPPFKIPLRSRLPVRLDGTVHDDGIARLS